MGVDEPQQHPSMSLCVRFFFSRPIATVARVLWSGSCGELYTTFLRCRSAGHGNTLHCTSTVNGENSLNIGWHWHGAGQYGSRDGSRCQPGWQAQRLNHAITGAI